MVLKCRTLRETENNCSKINTYEETNMNAVPEWISKELLENVLKKHFRNENVQVLCFQSSTALPAGENYTSSIFRTSIAYKSEENANKETIAVIIKCHPDNEMMIGLVEDYELFETEAFMYTNALPFIKNALGKEDSKTISANCLHYANKPNPIIMLEDLSAQNFKMCPRRKGLDLEHCLLVMEKLAHFHATSLLLHEKDPAPIEKFEKEGIYRENDFTYEWVKTCYGALSETCSKWPGYEKYSSKINSLKDHAVRRTLETKVLKDFNVLNHGDCWINNFMFSYDSDGKVEDMRFLDFQLVLYSSPVIDLLYFWATSPNMEVRSKHLDKIFDHYYNNLLLLATKLQRKIPSKNQLWEDFNSRAFYCLTAAVTVLPIVTASSRDEATIEEFLGKKGDHSFQRDAYNNDRYRQYMEFLLPFFDKLGVLD